MHQPLLSHQSSSCNFAPLTILPSIVLLFFVALVLNDQYRNSLEAPISRFEENPVGPGEKQSCRLFETAQGANEKCNTFTKGNIFTGRKPGALAPEGNCAKAKCVKKDHGVCCVKPIRCKQYQESAEVACPANKEENVDRKAHCKEFPCTQANDEATCCVPTGSNYRAFTRGEWGPALRVYASQSETDWVLKTFSPGRKVNILEQIKEGNGANEKIWGKVKITSRGDELDGYVVMKNAGATKWNLRPINMEQIEIPSCETTAEWDRFANARKGEVFEITCPDTCDDKMKNYDWKPKGTLYARESPESDTKIDGWTWTKTDAPLKFDITRAFGDRLWGYAKRQDNTEGWFKLLQNKAPFEAFANMVATDVTGCGNTFWGTADVIKVNSPICIAARTRWQFGGAMEINFVNEPKKYTQCDKGGVSTQAGGPNQPPKLAYRVGLAGQDKFKKSSTALGEMLTRRISRIKQPGKILLKMALKCAFGIALAVLVSMASAAVIAATGGAAAPLLIGIAFAIPQGFANHAIGLAIDTTVDRWWEKTSTDENAQRQSWWAAFKTKCKSQGWSGWLLGGLKGMIWPLLGQVSVINDAVTAGWGEGFLKIEPGEYSGSVATWITDVFGNAKGSIQMSIAFTGWIMNTILGLMNQVADRGRSRIDVFAVVVGLAANLVERGTLTVNGEIALGFPEEGVGIEDLDHDQLISSCVLDMNDPTKNCIAQHISFTEGVPVIPIALMGKIANNLGGDWRICTKTVFTEDGTTPVLNEDGTPKRQQYYCLAGDDYEKSDLYIEGMQEDRISSELEQPAEDNQPAQSNSNPNTERRGAIKVKKTEVKPQTQQNALTNPNTERRGAIKAIPNKKKL